MTDLTPKQIEDMLTDEEIKLLDNANYVKIWPALKSLAEARIENKELIGVVLGLRKNLGEYDELCIENPKLRIENKRLKAIVKIVSDETARDDGAIRIIVRDDFDHIKFIDDVTLLESEAKDE